MNSRHTEILKYIYQCVEENGYPPTVREICLAVGLSSPSTVHSHLKALEKNGYIEKDPTKPRALEITKKGFSYLGIYSLGIPIIGKVTAGEPITAVEHIDGYLPIAPQVTKKEEILFALQIKGESMIDAGIYHGDYVIVREQETCENGDIVIALTDNNEATCKRFFKEDGFIRLQPENRKMKPIILDRVDIIGRVVSLYREHLE